MYAHFPKKGNKGASKMEDTYCVAIQKANGAFDDGCSEIQPLFNG